VSAGDGVPMRRSTRFVARLAWTAAVAVAVEVPAPPLHIIDAEGAVTAASRPGGRSPGGAADAVGRREETAVVDFRQVESDAMAWLAGNGEERQLEQQADEETIAWTRLDTVRRVWSFLLYGSILDEHG